MRFAYNAFERADATVLDLLAYPNADIVASLRTDRMIAELPNLRPSLIRITMRPGFEVTSLPCLHGLIQHYEHEVGTTAVKLHTQAPS